MYTEGLILAGGGSTRMGGFHKGSLTYRNRKFTEILIQELKKEVSCVSLSYGNEKKEVYDNCPVVMDIYPGCGPIGGIHAGLKMCNEEWMLTAACDMPFLKIELFRYLEEKIKEKRKEGIPFDGAVPVTNGRIHPLAAVYRTAIVGVLEEQIKKGNYRLRDALKRLHILYADVTAERNFMQMLQNINTLEEYERMVAK